MRYITIALAKGRLAKKALEIFEHIGVTCDEMKDENTRKLIFTNEELGIRFFLAKPSDVPTYVEYGAADIGIVGKDTLLEEGRSLYEVYDLKIGQCKMCVCGPASAREKLQHHELIRVASKYPNIAKDYFYNKKHQTVEIIKLNGSVELAPIVGLSEVIVDIVETGATLRENGLEVLEEVCPLSARIVVNQVSMKMENERITKLINDIKNLSNFVAGGVLMKSTGIIRRVDELGRVVIPMELRNKFEIAEKDQIEIYVEGSNIILKKYEPNCIFCGNSKNLIAFKDKLVCPKCAEKIGAIQSTMNEEADE